MIQLAKILFSDGKVSQKEVDSIEECISKVNSQREWIHEQKVDDLLEFFEEVGKFWAKEFSNEIGLNSKHLTSFLSKSHLRKKLDIALHGNSDSLEQFVDLSDPELMFHAQPRGLVVHWIAGNVEILGIFSVLQALITKNVSIIKAPSKYGLLIKLIESLKDIKTSKINGSELLNCIEIVYIDRDDIKNQKLLSMEANVRIAWGGKDAVNSIVSLPKSPFTEDIIYGPKYSYSIIDEESLKIKSDKIAQRIAVDVSMFDQYAGSSPHTILIDTKNEKVIEEFSKKLAKSLDDVNRILIPKGESNPEKSLEIIDVRTEYGLKGKVLCSSGTEWTVILSNETTLANPTFSRVIHVRRLDLEGLLKENISRKIQTISMEIEQKKRFKLIDRLTLLAGDRCPNIGTASLFDSPWDGIFGMDRMVRWITTYKNKEN